MKKTAIFIIFCVFVQNSYAISTDASKFAQKYYAECNNTKKPKINVKKEHTLETPFITDKQNSQMIKFGWGDMTVKGCKKRRINYLVTFDENKKPIWSMINFYE